MFHIATQEEIKRGKVTDVYFERTVEILKTCGIEKKVKAEVYAKNLPRDWNYGVLAGVEEVIKLLEGLPIDVNILPEGSIFWKNQPIMQISGKYTDFAIFETPLLGLLCQSSGIATAASRCKIAAKDKTLLSFGARRMHPGIAPMIDRSAFIGGCDGVAVVKSAQIIGEEAKGTMPHSLILILENPIEAYKLFHKIEPLPIKRIALIDTFGDEKFEAIEAAKTLGEDLFAVRLDTPISRRGDFKAILEEVRWELDLRGFDEVKLFVSGGLNEFEILRLSNVADAFGVGTYLSNAPVIDFSLDIVEINGKPLAKRGKKSGHKKVLQCKKCHKLLILPEKKEVDKCECNGELLLCLKKLIKKGKITENLPSPQKIRNYVINQIKDLNLKVE
ncbi:MAG: nicotinate phosphoribosyltransferase [bacterium]|nr:nicotinate phosphoribosyltransferase [bacterium]